MKENKDNEGRQVAVLPPAVTRDGDSLHSVAPQPRANMRSSVGSGWSYFSHGLLLSCADSALFFRPALFLHPNL